MKKFLFLFFIFCCVSFRCMAENIIGDDAIFYKFIKALDVGEKSATFVQTKTFLKYKKSFVVTGDVKFIKNVGFLWRQIEPKSFRFIATKERYCLDNGQIKNISDLPYMEKIKEVVDDVVNGDFSKMNDAFIIKYSEDEKKQNWSLNLVPKISKISSVIKNISLSGDIKKLFSFSIEYLNGILISVVFEEFDGGIIDEIKC